MPESCKLHWDKGWKGENQFGIAAIQSMASPTAKVRCRQDLGGTLFAKHKLSSSSLTSSHS